MTELLEQLDLPWTGSWVEPLFGIPLRIALILIAGFLVRHLLHRVIQRVCAGIAQGAQTLTRLEEGRDGDPSRRAGVALLTDRREQRAGTISSILKSLTTAVVSSVVIIMVLDLLSIPVAPLLASAGIVGVAVGFGAQSLVKDVISGVFMLVEDQYGVGDVVDLGDASGSVEAVGLRVSRLRDVDGTVWYVRNGEIQRVGNRSHGWARAVLDVPVAYGEDVGRAETLLKQTAVELKDSPDFAGLILDEPEVWGVEDVSADSVVIRLVVKTRPLKQWDVARELRSRIKIAFDSADVRVAHSVGAIRIAETTRRTPAKQGEKDDADEAGQ